MAGDTAHVRDRRAYLRDSALPTLADAFDPDRLSVGFAGAWRRAEGASIRLQVGDRLDTRYVPGRGCAATYAVSLDHPEERGRTSIAVVEIDRSGTTYRRFMDDPNLPGLTAAADADAMRGRLARASGRAPFDATPCRAIPLRYKPRRSCVIRYELGPPEARRSLIGKVFASDVGGRASTLEALAEASAGRAGIPSVASPIGVWPELGLIVQRAVDGADLTTAAIERSSAVSAGAALMRAAGRGLAAFHTAVTVAGPAHHWRADLEALAMYRPLFELLTPEAAGRVDGLIRRLDDEARLLPEPVHVPSHGALRTDQVLVDRHGGLVFVDLDGFCWANPARDLANLLAYMEWRAIRRPDEAATLTSAMDAVLDGYAALEPLPHEGWLGVYRAATMVKIAGRRLRRLAFDEWAALPELIDRAGRAVTSPGSPP